MTSLERFLWERLRLKVNRSKSAVARPWRRKFLGYSVTANHKPRLKVAPESVKRLKAKLRPKLRAGRGRDLARTIRELTPVTRGWVAYYRLAEVKQKLRDSGRVAPAETALHRVAAVEAATDPAPKAPRTRTGTGSCSDLGLQRPGASVERRVEPHAPGLTDRRAGHEWDSRAFSRSIGDSRAPLEPPDADRHVRWCESWGRVTAPGYSM